MIQYIMKHLKTYFHSISFVSFFCIGIAILLFLNTIYNWGLFRFFDKIFIEEEIYLHIIHSIKRVLIWFFFASVFWITFWFVLGMFKKISFVRYILEIIRPIPPIAWIPLAILRFWLWDVSSYFIVFVWSFFPIFTNTYFWVTSIPQIYLDVSKNMELNRIDFYCKVVWKYALPYIFSWLRIWLWMWWMSLIAAELIWAQSWLWYYIQINRLLLNMENVVLWMAIIGIIWFWLNYSLIKIEKLLVRWEQ
jgi:NitT/TauT family transport system permease protein/sulfonate transport system permease protein